MVALVAAVRVENQACIHLLLVRAMQGLMLELCALRVSPKLRFPAHSFSIPQSILQAVDSGQDEVDMMSQLVEQLVSVLWRLMSTTGYNMPQSTYLGYEKL